MTKPLTRLLTGAALLTALVLPAVAQSPGPKSINTGGPSGAYHTLFCPPIPVALAGAYFQGYACTPSAGTVENIQRVLGQPSQLGFALSTTHVATGAILGSGVGKPGAQVRWRVAGRMVAACFM